MFGNTQKTGFELTPVAARKATSGSDPDRLAVGSNPSPGVRETNEREFLGVPNGAAVRLLSKYHRKQLVIEEDEVIDGRSRPSQADLPGGHFVRDCESLEKPTGQP